MRPQVLTTVALTDDANGIFEDQTTGGAADLVLDGALVESGVAHCYGSTSKARQAQLIAIEGAGNNSGVVATITGTGGGDEPLVEALTLANAGTATSVAHFKSVSSISVDGAVTGNIEGGWLLASTNAMATQAFKTDYAQLPHNQSVSVDLSSGASLTYSVQHAFDLPQDDYGTSTWDASATWRDTTDLGSQTATKDGNYIAPVTGVRLLFEAYTSGTVKFTSIQGHQGY